MNTALSRLVLRCYPLAFRRRYGAELRALLDEEPVGSAAVLDLARGALLAHARPPHGLRETVDAEDRMRASVSGVLACWVAFAFFGFGFYKTTEDTPFTAAGNAHTLLGLTHGAVQAAAVLASLAVVIGAMPLIAAAVRGARAENRLIRLVRAPLLAVLLFAAFTAMLVALAHHGDHATPLSRGVFVAWALAGLSAGAVCVISARRALFAASVPRTALTGALLAATLVTVAMSAIVVATVAYAAALPADAPALAAAPDGPLRLTDTTASLIIQSLAMALAAALACTTSVRGWRTTRSTPS